MARTPYIFIFLFKWNTYKMYVQSHIRYEYRRREKITLNVLYELKNIEKVAKKYWKRHIYTLLTIRFHTYYYVLLESLDKVRKMEINSGKNHFWSVLSLWILCKFLLDSHSIEITRTISYRMCNFVKGCAIAYCRGKIIIQPHNNWNGLLKKTQGF